MTQIKHESPKRGGQGPDLTPSATKLIRGEGARGGARCHAKCGDLALGLRAYVTPTAATCIRSPTVTVRDANCRYLIQAADCHATCSYLDQVTPFNENCSDLVQGL